MCCQHQIVFLHNVRLFDRVNLSCIYVICFYIQLFMLSIVVFVSKPLLVCHVAHQRTWMRHAGYCTRFIGTLDRVALCFFPNTSWTSGWLKVSQVNDFNAAILFPQNTTTWYVFIDYQLNLDIMFFHHVFWTIYKHFDQNVDPFLLESDWERIRVCLVTRWSWKSTGLRKNKWHDWSKKQESHMCCVQVFVLSLIFSSSMLFLPPIIFFDYPSTS